LIHLHNHTEYSLLDGVVRIKDLVKAARSFNMPAVAITDHANLYGVVEFYKTCKEAEIKPIIGCELYTTPNRLEKDTQRNHLVLLCKDKTGYNNLIKLVSRANTEGFYYKPRIDRELLEQHHEGLIALSGCMAGEIPQLILAGKLAEAEKTAEYYRDLLGEDFYLELQDHGIPEQTAVNRELVQIADKLKIPLVATNDVHYLEQKDAYIQDVLLCIGTKDVLSNPERFRFDSDQFYFKSPEEMKDLFGHVPEALKNTFKVAEKCNLEFDFGQHLLPKFPTDNPEALLRALAFKGLLPRYGPSPSKEVMARVNYELEVITKMGFADYFLIVHDIINWARENNIPVGPGRGSAAGSIVAYLLGITQLCPLKNGLLFERFLNPARISMPDIDIDFCYDRRQEVIDYIIRRYGQDRVAQIITFGTMAAKAAIRDVGRVMEKPLSDIDRLAKRTEVLSAATDPELQDVIDVAREVEGKPRHTGTHAAGVIIAPGPITDYVPVQLNNGNLVTQFDMGTCEEIGLLKMDILGLKTLTVISDTLKLIGGLDINKIPLDDRKTYSLLSRGETIGVFQVESPGMQGILKKMRPSRFEDLVAAVALFRPGPLGSGMVDDYIDGKHGKKKVKYLHPVLESILKETYGVILYQEQTMKIATDMAGFSLAEADNMRRAIGKKKPEVLKTLREAFVKGCEARGIDKKIAEEVFTLIDYFSGYGFNKSHSAAYALIAYQTAYLKAHYPAEFMTALLSNTSDQDKIALYLSDCRRMGIKMLPPDINKSKREFTLDKGAIRFGLGAVKNLGDAALDKIISNQPYKDIYDLVYKTHLNKAALETLARSGCLLPFGTRKAVTEAIPAVIQATSQVGQGEITLFGSADELLPEITGTEEYDLEALLGLEKELLGFYISAHPLDNYKLPRCTPIAEVREGNCIIAGVVTSKKSGISAKGKRWCLLSVEDYTGSMDVLYFDSEDIREGKAYAFKGRLRIEDEQAKLFCFEYGACPRKEKRDAVLRCKRA